MVTRPPFSPGARESPPGGSATRPGTSAGAVGAVVAGLGVWVAWRPIETSPLTAAVAAAAITLVLPRTWRPGDGAGLAAAALGVAWLAVSAARGPDPAAGLEQIALLVLACVVGWTAARHPAGGTLRLAAGLGLASLSLWAAWQSAFGLERAAELLAQLPPDVQPVARARVESGRGFASLTVPGHLALLQVVAAMVLLSARTSRRWGVLRWSGVGLAACGLLVTRSPIGAVLAGGAAMALAAAAGRARAARALLAAAVVLVAAVTATRPDVLRLEPVALRIDNWRTAVWLAGASPVGGVGFGGFGLAAATVPLEVGNRPAHAHNLALELIAELGVAGLAATVAGLAALVLVVRRGWGREPALAVAVTAVAVHNLADFSLFSSGVLVPAALVTGWLVAAGRGGVPGPADRAGAARALAVAIGASAVALGLLHATSVALEEASWAAAAGERFRLADRAARLAPWRPAAAATAAAIALESPGRPEVAAALRHLEQAIRLRPGSSLLRALESRLRVVARQPLGAVASAWTACRNQSPADTACRDLEQLLSYLDGADDRPLE